MQSGINMSSCRAGNGERVEPLKSVAVSEFRSCVKVEVAVLGFPSLGFPWMVSNTEPCSRTGLCLSLICQPTSEDIKQDRKEAHCQMSETVRQKQRGQEQWPGTNNTVHHPPLTQ